MQISGLIRILIGILIGILWDTVYFNCLWVHKPPITMAAATFIAIIATTTNITVYLVNSMYQNHGHYLIS